MNTEQAIKVIERQIAIVEPSLRLEQSVLASQILKDKVDANKLAIAALRAQQVRENPKPLTLEELKEREWKNDTQFTHSCPNCESVSSENKRLRKRCEAAEEDFLDYATSGTDNFAPFCANASPECVDARGWCNNEKCKGRKWTGPQEGEAEAALKARDEK